MTNRLRCHMAAGFIAAIAFASSVGIGQAQDLIQVPPLPDGLGVEAGNNLFLAAHATGTQNYLCQPTASGFVWQFSLQPAVGAAPQATLFQSFKIFGSDFQQQVITHFLSPNPAEDGLPRATWQSSLDTSAVWAKVKTPSTDPRFVAQGAIPWLLLEAVGSQRGPSGGSILTPTTFVQRLNTHGGVAPAANTCSVAADVGKVAMVPYSADYFFYKKPVGKN